MITHAAIRHEQDLVRVAPKDPSSYADIPLALLTAFSLYWLHRWELRRTIEAIAVLNWRLFPTKFSMVGFAQFPDAFRTNRSLLQGQPKYRNLLTGSAGQGFSLNERGIEIARDLTATLGPPVTVEGGILGEMPSVEARVEREKRNRSIEPAHEMDRVRASKLFDKWKLGSMSDRDLIHVHAMLGIFDHTPVKQRRKLMKDLESNATDAHDDEVLHFLSDVRRSFPEVFVL